MFEVGVSEKSIWTDLRPPWPWQLSSHAPLGFLSPFMLPAAMLTLTPC